MSTVNCMKLSILLEEKDHYYYSRHFYYTNDEGNTDAQIICANIKDITNQELDDFLEFLHKEKCMYGYEHFLVRDGETEVYSYSNDWENSYDKSSNSFNYQHIDNDIVFRIR